MMLGGFLVGFIRKLSFCRSTVLISAAAFSSACYIAIGFTGSFACAVGLYLAGMLAGGIYGPIKQSFLHAVTPSAQRATVLSFDSMISSGAGMTGQFGLGWIGRAHGLDAS